MKVKCCNCRKWINLSFDNLMHFKNIPCSQCGKTLKIGGLTKGQKGGLTFLTEPEDPSLNDDFEGMN